MAVAATSLITLEDYKSYAGVENNQIERDALSVYGSDGTAATVGKTGDTLTLIKTGGANPGTTNIDLTAAAYDTLGEVVTYINTIAGWVANLTGWSSAPSIDLKNIAATNCLGTDNEQTLKFYDNYILEKLVDRASVIIEDYLNRIIKSAAYYFERHDGGGEELFLHNFPVTAIQQICVGTLDVIKVKRTATTLYNAYVSIDRPTTTLKMMSEIVADATIDFSQAANDTLGELVATMNAVSGWTASIANSLYSAWPSAQLFTQLNKYCANEDVWLEVPDEPLNGYEVDTEKGIVKLRTGVGFQNVFVSYTAGFATVPYSIVSGCCRFVEYLDNLRERDESLKSESKLDYKWSAVDLEKALKPAQMEELKRYRSWNV